MRLLLSSLFQESPFVNLQRHADKIRECAQLFREAAICHVDERCGDFDGLTDRVARIESEADAIKRNIRNHLPRGILMAVDKFQFLQYLREQDKVLDEVEEALLWLSLRPKGIPGTLAEDFQHLVTSVIPAIEKLPELVSMATRFFKSRSNRQRKKMKSLIQDIRQDEKEADFLERELKLRIFSEIKDPLVVFHMVRLIEIVGNIADHAQNASDRMRAMIAK
ncbi:MAG: TIGR00153 family protein [Deltaproteobacteria bacterium]|nr:TIGR00153 family protein [Deltaproteobacteria bacterium]MBW2047513.1 TIGR00153 family protein [Deltaproteobacteria bacterium]MBW2111739.1 TIGR00153 family protein [Deltaproteobacteria bacterium]MBW2352104.1 TIGR00153 family protein [Deltaproteobacteria bacterium]HDZ89758.1 TIGR00153 family protein [Deltaproteobacteria bacterium]